MEYRIGDFALITRMSVKMLRRYHEEGIIEPTRIDYETGYRYYSQGLILKAKAIMKLREWDFSLKEIKEVLDDYQDDEDIIEYVAIKVRVIQEKIKRMSKIEGELSYLLKMDEEARKLANQDVTVKNLSPLKIISTVYRGTFDECGPSIELVYKIGGVKAKGSSFHIYHSNENRESGDIEVCLPVKSRINNPKVNYKILPEVKVVTTIHIGPYETLGKAYQRLIDYREAQQFTQCGPVREHHLKGPGFVFEGDPEKYVTEIQMPIK